MFLNQNLTKLHFGPKITCREPGRLEVSLFARGTWRIPLSGPLEQIEDPVEQGFMSGDVFADTDPERTGPVLYASDFGDYKPRADLLLKGTCYPPGGRPTDVCPVRFTVGEWSKSLVAVGARAWRPGVLFGASLSEPSPFTRMPLTWENAFGGESHADNPVGKGVTGDVLPTVEDPRQPIKGRRDRPTPASFLPISPNWPQRLRKRGKKYGATYVKTRAPWYSEDFDWTYFNAAPEDQQLDRYLRGDEALTFTNLHPEASELKTRLPGLRVRCFLKHTDQRFVEVRMELDTLYADLDARKLYLTWRGLSPVEHMEFEDIACGLVVQESLEDPPKSAEHYRQVLEAFEADPLGLEDKFPPGFLEMGEKVAAEEAAELAGAPVPMDQRVDPFGIRAMFPAGVLAAYAAGSDDPLGIKERFPEGFLELGESLEVGEVPVPPGLEGHPQVAELGEQDLLALNLVPGEQRVTVLEKLLEAKEKSGAAAQAPSEPTTLFSILGTSLAVPPAPPAMPAIPDDMQVEDPRPKLQALSEELEARKQRYLDKGIDSPLLGLFDRGQRMIAAATAMAAGMLDHPAPPPSGPDLSPAKKGLEDAKQAMLDHGDGRYDEQQAKLDDALAELAELQAAFPPRSAEPPAGDERDFFGQDLRGQDFSGQDLSGKSFAKANLGGANLAGARLGGAIFREANLCKANLSGADLSGAHLEAAAILQTNLRGARLDGARILGSGVGGADLRGASLVGADLSGSSFEGALLAEADLSGVEAGKVTFRKADLTATRFVKARLAEADFSWARGLRANFLQADLTKAVLTRAEFAEANLAEAVLVEANLEHVGLGHACLDRANLDSAIGEHMDLSQASLKGAKLTFLIGNKSLLEGADLTGADLSLASLILVRGDRCDLSDTQLGMTKLSKSRLRGATLTGCRGQMAQLDACDLREASLSGADLTTFNLGEADLEDADLTEATLVKASLRGVKATRACFTRANLTHAALSEGADFTHARFLAIEAPKSIWFGATLDRADFSWARLPGSFFDGVRAKRTRFFAADLGDATFRKAKLDTPFLVSANLKRADLSMATVLDGQFQQANCYGMVLLGTELAKCDFAEAFVEALREDKDTVRV